MVTSISDTNNTDETEYNSDIVSGIANNFSDNSPFDTADLQISDSEGLSYQELVTKERESRQIEQLIHELEAARGLATDPEQAALLDSQLDLARTALNSILSANTSAALTNAVQAASTFSNRVEGSKEEEQRKNNEITHGVYEIQEEERAIQLRRAELAAQQGGHNYFGLATERQIAAVSSDLGLGNSRLFDDLITSKHANLGIEALIKNDPNAAGALGTGQVIYGSKDPVLKDEHGNNVVKKLEAQSTQEQAEAIAYLEQLANENPGEHADRINAEITRIKTLLETASSGNIQAEDYNLRDLREQIENGTYGHPPDMSAIANAVTQKADETEASLEKNAQQALGACCNHVRTELLAMFEKDRGKPASSLEIVEYVNQHRLDEASITNTRALIEQTAQENGGDYNAAIDEVMDQISAEDRAEYQKYKDFNDAAYVINEHGTEKGFEMLTEAQKRAYVMNQTLTTIDAGTVIGNTNRFMDSLSDEQKQELRTRISEQMKDGSLTDQELADFMVLTQQYTGQDTLPEGLTVNTLKTMPPEIRDDFIKAVINEDKETVEGYLNVNWETTKQNAQQFDSPIEKEDFYKTTAEKSSNGLLFGHTELNNETLNAFSASYDKMDWSNISVATAEHLKVQELNTTQMNAILENDIYNADLTIPDTPATPQQTETMSQNGQFAHMLSGFKAPDSLTSTNLDINNANPSESIAPTTINATERSRSGSSVGF